MKLKILESPEALGIAAANGAAGYIRQAIETQGKARIVLSTGASQFETLKALVKIALPWDKVEMFHLDEYVGLPQSHPASFRKYLQERFVDLVHPGKVFFVNGEGDYQSHIQHLTRLITEAPIDLAIVGIGENAHIAFNDPPADFKTEESYIVVKLDDHCKKQQVREGWFPDLDSVPREAISMTVHQMMASRTIISPVPHRVKAEAIKAVFEKETTPEVPATILKQHSDWLLFLDQQSAALLEQDKFKFED